MTLNIDLRHHFGAPVLAVNLPAFPDHRDALISFIHELKGASDGVRRSNQTGSWHSREDLYKEDLPVIHWLCSRILELGSRGIATAMGRDEPVSLRIGSLWANVNEPEGWNAPHHHLPADWSGVFWVDAEAETPAPVDVIPPGALLFIDPMPLAKAYGRNRTQYYLPSDGGLMFFPAYMVHMVAPHQRSKPRLSMSFNLKFKDDEAQGE